MLSLERIERAAATVDPVFRNTPQFEPESLGRAVGTRVVVKVESVNPIRSFKGRGADFFLATRDNAVTRLVCASAGNFGQGLAWTARRRGLRCDVFAAENANPFKVDRMRSLGARVHRTGRDFDDAKAAARAFAEQESASFVEDGREPAIAEGAGSIAVELCTWPERFDVVIVPLGNGALLGGIATWIKSVAPDTRVIGVVAAGAPSMQRSWTAGRIVETDHVDTIADGIAVRVPIQEALDSFKGVVDQIVLASEWALRRAIGVVFEATGLAVEPAGAAGIAALMEHQELATGLVATPLCGGNLSPEQLTALAEPFASRS